MRSNPVRTTGRDGGYAVVTAVLASMVVLTLSVLALSLSSHNQDASAHDRERVRGVHAAEDGINAALGVIRVSDAPAQLPCSLQDDLTDSLTAHYDVTIHYYESWPFDDTTPTMACGEGTGLSAAPGAVLIEAVGEANGVRRRMETAARLSPAYGGAFDKAIFSHSSPDVGNDLVIEGDVYTNQDWACPNKTVVNGNLYVQGSIDMANTCEVKKDGWAGGTIGMRNAARIGHDAIAAGVDEATGHSIVLQKNEDVRIVNRVVAAGTCDGCDTPRVDPDLVATNQSSVSPPPQEPFPELHWVATDWTDEGFLVHEVYSCADALTKIEALADAASPNLNKNVVRIYDRCLLSFARDAKFALGNDLAIVTDGSIEFVNEGEWVGKGSPTRTLYLIVPYLVSNSAGTTPCDGAGNGDITKENATRFVDMYFFVYTPCEVTFANQNDSDTEGQIYGGTVELANFFRITGRAAFVPGTGNGELVGYRSEVAYIREITL